MLVGHLPRDEIDVETGRGSERLREAERRNAEDIREADPALTATGRQPAAGGAVRSA